MLSIIVFIIFTKSKALNIIALVLLYLPLYLAKLDYPTCGFTLNTPGFNFINVRHTAFTHIDPKSVNRYSQLYCLFYAFGLHPRNSCTSNVDEIDG